MRFLFIAMLVLSSLLSFNAFASKQSVPVVDYDKQAIHRLDGKSLEMPDVETAITKAAASTKWTLEKAGEGHFIATAKRGAGDRHTLIVDIEFSTAEYSIRYRDSINLNSALVPAGVRPVKIDGRMEIVKQDAYREIHPNYNRWVDQLRQAIDSNLRY